LFYDEGPDVGGNYGPYIQSERKPIYREYINKLLDLGGAHYCFCQKNETSAADGNPNIGFIDPCNNIPLEEAKKRVAAGEAYTVRQNIPQGGQSSYDDMVYGRITVPYKDMDESILFKSDGFPTYNFANVIDDRLMEITHVIRGNEYLSQTAKYNLIYKSFGWEPPQYIHLPQVMKDQNNKLSKRNSDVSFASLVENKGFLPEAIINYMALLGWSPKSEQEFFTLAELEKAFSIAGVNRSSALFDEVKMRWMNGEYIRKLLPDEFHKRAMPFYASCIKRETDLLELSKILQSRVETMGDIAGEVDFIDALPDYDTALYENKKMKTDRPTALKALQLALERLPTLQNWDDSGKLHDEVGVIAASFGLSNGQFLWPLRIALTGKQFSAGGAISAAYVLGRDESLRRIRIGIEKLS
ncbi:MAG: glutamate--tRNA ligase, partial [Alphaproteobacteria bacterium]|nr:glutamate--tRNA ligase [Alphaproteobacteria bacterium]